MAKIFYPVTESEPEPLKTRTEETIVVRKGEKIFLKIFHPLPAQAFRTSSSFRSTHSDQLSRNL